MRRWEIDGPDQAWFTLKEVLSYLDISERMLRDLIKQGRFPRGTRFTRGGARRWSGLDIALYTAMRRLCLDPEGEDDLEKKSDDDE